MLDFLAEWAFVAWGLTGLWLLAEAAARLGPKAVSARLAPLRRGDAWVAGARTAVMVLAGLTAVATVWRGEVRFAHPGALWMLPLLPAVAALSVRNLAGLEGARRGWAVALRCAVLALLITSLADPQRRRVNEELAVVVVLDVSTSIPDDLLGEAVATINKWAERAGGKDRIKVITFAGEPRTETPFLSRLKIYDLQNLPARRDQTDLAAAMRLALDSFPPDLRRRLVVVSDGNQNVGDARGEAVAAAARGIPVDTVTLQYAGRNEVLVDHVRAPASADEKQTVEITAGIRTLRNCRVRVRLFDEHDGDREVKISPPGAADPWVEVDLQGGSGRRGMLNTITLTRPNPAPGLHRWRVEIEPVPTVLPDGTPADYRKQNNVGTAATVVTGTPQVLLVTTDQARDRRLIAALSPARLGIKLTVRTPETLPPRAEMFHFDAVLLSNVPAGRVAEGRRADFEQYVRDTGGGLVMIGGEASFGAGEWRTEDPVGRTLPVTMEVKNFKVRQKGALVLVMHACEMPDGNFWSTKIAEEAIKSMSRLDDVGVIEFGGSGPRWVVDLQPKTDEARILARVRNMAMGDMPDLDAVLEAAVAKLATSDAANKHVIIISDGDPRMPDNNLVGKMKAGFITASCVAVSPHALTPQDLGPFKQVVDRTNRAGRGQFYIIDDRAAKGAGPKTLTIDGERFPVRSSDELPNIYLQETRLVRRPLIVNLPEGFRAEPAATGAAPAEDPLSGWDVSDLPKLRGYVMTSAKPGAFVPLLRRDPADASAPPDPILAHWRFGIGKAVAWTPDARDVWAAEWVAGRPEFDRLWEQVVRWVRRPAADPEISAVLTRDGDIGRLTVTAIDGRRHVRTDAAFTAAIVEPDGTTRAVNLVPDAAGGFGGSFRISRRGTYFAVARWRPTGAGADDGRPTERFARVAMDVAYEDEFRTWSADPGVMASLTSSGAAGGKAILGVGTAEAGGLEVFRRDGLPPAESWQSLSLTWEAREGAGWLAKLRDLVLGMPLPAWMCVLFLLDVMVRRVQFPGGGPLRALGRMLGLVRASPKPITSGAGSGSVSELRGRPRAGVRTTRAFVASGATPTSAAGVAASQGAPPNQSPNAAVEAAPDLGPAPVVPPAPTGPAPAPAAGTGVPAPTRPAPQRPDRSPAAPAAAPRPTTPPPPSVPTPGTPPVGTSGQEGGAFGRLRAAKQKAREDLDQKKDG